MRFYILISNICITTQYSHDDYVDDAEEDQFEELEPLPAEPLASTDDADGIVDLDDADDDFEELEIT